MRKKRRSAGGGNSPRQASAQKQQLKNVIRIWIATFFSFFSLFLASSLFNQAAGVH